jgi:hypothetical protein
LKPSGKMSLCDNNEHSEGLEQSVNLLHNFAKGSADLSLVNDTPMPCNGEDGLVALIMAAQANRKRQSSQ